MTDPDHPESPDGSPHDSPRGAPRVSVIIPTYNRCELLREALMSLVEQTYTNWEAIIIDDYSDDETIPMVRAFADPRMEIINFRSHRIIATSRNKGIERARGEWIAFLDSDDLWLPDKLQRVFSEDIDAFDIITHRETTFGHDGDRATSPHHKPQDAGYRALLFKGNCFSPSAALVRRSRLNEIKGFKEDADYMTVEDYDLWLRLIQAAAKVKSIDAVLSKYRLHENNASGAALKHMAAGLKAVDNHFQRLTPKRLFDGVRWRRRRAMIIYGAARSFRAAREFKDARTYCMLSLKAYPLYMRALIALMVTYLPPRIRPH